MILCTLLSSSGMRSNAMGLNAESTLRSGFVHVIVTGEFDLDDAKRNFLETLDLLEQHALRKVLLDGREISGEPEIVERFYYGEFVADSTFGLIDRGWTGELPQFAYVLHEPVLDPLRLGETVAVNRGVNVKVFEEEPDALDWLGLD